jgi:hypothetical protein
VAATTVASISRWSGGSAGGRGGQEARGMGGSILHEKGREWGREQKNRVTTGGAYFKWRAEVGNGSVGWCHTSGVEEGTRRGGRRRRSAGKGPEADGCERRWHRRAARARACSYRGERALAGGGRYSDRV